MKTEIEKLEDKLTRQLARVKTTAGILEALKQEGLPTTAWKAWEVRLDRQKTAAGITEQTIRILYALNVGTKTDNQA